MFTPVLRLTAVLCLAFGVATAKIQGDDCSIYSLNQCDGGCRIVCLAIWTLASLSVLQSTPPIPAHVRRAPIPVSGGSRTAPPLPIRDTRPPAPARRPSS